MKNQSNNTLCKLLAALLLLAGGLTVHAQTAGPAISVQFPGSGPTATALTPDQAAGVISVTNWNVDSAASGVTVTGLGDSEASGATVSLAITYSAGQYYTSANPALSPDFTLNSGGDYSGSGYTITVSGVPYPTYDVYLYVLNYQDGLRFSATLTNAVVPTYWGAVYSGPDLNFGGNPYDYVVAVDTADAGSSSAQTQANYVYFTGMTNGNFTITGQTPDGNIGLMGIQIVNTTPGWTPPANGYPPVIFSQPTSIPNGYVGQNVQFSVTVGGGTAPFSYQWQKNGTNLTDGGNIIGSVSNILSISSVGASDAANYQVVITNAAGSVTSSVAVLGSFTLPLAARIAWAGPGYITTADATLDQPGTLVGAETFGGTEEVVTLTNGNTVDFKADNSVASYSGAYNKEYGNFSFSGSGNANFDTVCSEGNYDANPNVATINNLIPGHTYTVLLSGIDDRGAYGYDQIYFRDPVDATDYSVTNYVGGSNLGSTNTYVTGTFTALAATENVNVYFQGANGGTFSFLVLYDVTSLVPRPPVIATQPQSLTNGYAGQTVQFSVTAGGTAPLHYNWRKSGANLADGGNISGSTSNTLSIVYSGTSDLANYQVVVTNSLGSATSSVATLSGSFTLPLVARIAWAGPGYITTADATLDQPGTLVGAETFGGTEEVVTLTNGENVDFKADGSVASYSGAYYKEYNGFGFSGSGNANFDAVCSEGNYDTNPNDVATINNLIPGHTYTVLLSGIDNRTTSFGSDQIYFQDPVDATDYSVTNYVGGSAIGSTNTYVTGTFTAVAATENVHVYFQGADGGTFSFLVLYDVTPTNEAPLILTQPPSVTNGFAWEQITLPVVAAGTAPLYYQWRKNGANLTDGGHISGSATRTLIINNASASDVAGYQVIITNAYGAVTSSVVNVGPLAASSPSILWYLPIAITTADAMLNQSGTLVGAETFGGSEEVVTLTNGNTVDFKANGSVATATGNGTYGGFNFSGSGNANFDAALSEANYDGGPKTITINNLTAGQQYSVLLVGLDDRNSGYGARPAYFQDPVNANDVSATVTMGQNVYVQGVFTASAATQNIIEQLPNGGAGNINVLVLYSLPPSAPAHLTNSWSAGQLTLSWPAGNTLLEATNLSGPWTTNSATSPYVVTPATGAKQMFFRLIGN